RGILDLCVYSDGQYWDLLYMPGGGSRHPATPETVAARMHYAKMKGSEVFKVAVRMFVDCAERILKRNGVTADDVSLFIPHQANLRIIEAAAKRVGLPMERVFVNVDRYGHTGAASVFPGQGAQAVGMGKGFYATSAGAKAVFEEANAALGFNLARLMFEGPEADLALTANTQPAVLTASVAAAAACAERGLRPALVGGHSLGEYSALVVARALRFGDAVRIVRKRGEFMQDAVSVRTGAMAAILGLDLAQVERVCAEAAKGEAVGVADVNSAQQIVVAGHRAAVERAVALASHRGGTKSVMLP